MNYASKNNTVMIPIEIIEKYAGKPIAIRGYDGDPENDYYVGDFIDPGMFSCVFAEVDSSESDFTAEGCELLNEPFWETLVATIIKEEGDVFIREGERINDPAILLHELKSVSPLYKPGETQAAPYPIVFSDLPRREILDGIKKSYGTTIDRYLDIITKHSKNRSLLNRLTKLFESFGYTSLRGYRYRIVLKNYWFWVNLNKRDYWNEFRPFISLAPIIEDGSMHKQAYHERHESTKMYKCLERTILGKPNEQIDEQEFALFYNSIEKLLSDISAEKNSEEELLINLDKNFSAINQEERSLSPFNTSNY